MKIEEQQDAMRLLARSFLASAQGFWLARQISTDSQCAVQLTCGSLIHAFQTLAAASAEPEDLISMALESINGKQGREYIATVRDGMKREMT